MKEKLLREASRKERTQRRNYTFFVQLSGDEISNQQTSNIVGSPAGFRLTGQLGMGTRNMLAMRKMSLISAL